MNEKTLVKLMKTAYKGGGVKVWRAHNDILYLAGPGWACAMLWKYVPGPVLGLIAAWCHSLPEAGQGWWCLDAAGEEPEPLDGMPEPLPALGSALPLPGGQLLALKLTCGAYQAAQRADRRIVWFEMTCIDLLDRLTTVGGGELLPGPDGAPWGRWHDPETGTVVFLETADRIRPDLTAKLGEIDYRKLRGGDTGC